MRTLVLLATLVVSVAPVAQDCGDVRLTTQAEVDAFDCTEVGYLTITDDYNSDDDVTDLSPLAGLTSVIIEARIEATYLTNLSGLGGLRSAGRFLITGNPFLTSLDGLDALEEVTEWFAVGDNAALADVGELPSLVSAGYLSVSNNPSLTSLAGLSGARAKRALIGGNNRLTSLDGLEGVSSLEQLRLENNNQLADIDALGSVTEISQGLQISDNRSLASCSCGLAGVIDDGTFAGV